MKYLFVLTFILASFNSYSQTLLNEINFSLIPYNSVVKFINDSVSEHAQKISDIHPSCQSDMDFSSFKKQEKKYLIKDKFSRVWTNYVNTSPTESWEGKLVSFGVLLSKTTNSIIYPGDDFKVIEKGQVIFLNLKLLKGIYQLAMAFEVIKVDKDKGLIEFSYIEGNTSKGMQRLHFSETPEGYTSITHSSYYKSHSALRDKVFYPFFHKKATNEFHRNLRRKAKHVSKASALASN